MTTRSTRSPLYLFTLLGLLVWAPGQAGDLGSQGNFGSSFFSTSPPCPLNQFPALESVAPIPAVIDPFEQDLIPMFCQIQVKKRGLPVNKAKGNYESELYVLDNNTGMFETFPIGSGKFKTNSEGFDSFDFEIPSEIFADGFESGDVSAWSYTRADFTKKRKADEATLQCGSSGSK